MPKARESHTRHRNSHLSRTPVLHYCMDGAGSQKRCSRCRLVKSVAEFTFKNRATGLLHSFCRACHKAWNRAHYERNRDQYIASAKRNNAIYIAENLRRLLEFLLDHPYHIDAFTPLTRDEIYERR